MEILTSRSNPRLRHVIRLRTGRYRRKAAEFVVDGAREIRRAMDAAMELVELFVEHPGSEHKDYESQAFYRAALSQGRCTLVAAAAFEKLAYGERNEGLVAVFKTPPRGLDQLHLPPSPLVIVADQIEKPGNLGAILRSADAAGADAVICCDCRTDLFHPNVIRASLATVFSLPMAVADAATTQAYLDQHGIRCIAARVDADVSLWESDLSGSVALVLGAESEGLGPHWQCSGIAIPMAGRADSLNVSVAAAVLAFEASRQRRSAAP